MKQRQHGFTIVELLIYTGILVSFLYVVTNIFVTVVDMQLESETTSAVSQDSRFILARLHYDVARASSITQPASLGQQSSTLILHIGNADYTYAVVNGALQLTDPTETSQLNSFGTTVSNVSFRRYGNVTGKPSVRIAFTLTSTSSQRVNGPDIQDFAATYGTR